jgi:hypothetical protein
MISGKRWGINKSSFIKACQDSEIWQAFVFTDKTGSGITETGISGCFRSKVMVKPYLLYIFCVTYVYIPYLNTLNICINYIEIIYLI